ncbi:MAG: hypothetical protein LBI14_11860 [Treponema sp.]|jgi:hypothetical protein|nr:hypothetical protein [Treponema sp.]
MRSPFLSIGLFAVLISLAFPAIAQTSGTSFGLDLSGTPLWVRDLRRAEIVAFGSFPFTFFFTSFTMDSIRLVSHNWDGRYAPWPFRAAGAIDMTRNEKMLTLGIAAGTSILIALIDYLIVRSQRNKRNQEILSMPPGTPIIIRRPAEDNESAPPSEIESEVIDAP